MKTASSILIALLTLWQFTAGAGPNVNVDADVVRRTAELLLKQYERQHVDQHEIARRWARMFLLALDPHRMHFLASDADEFMKRSPGLLADARKGRVDFALLVADRFRTRLDANSSFIRGLLTAKHDFTVDESVQLEHETYAATEADCHERWRLRIKYELLLENADDPGAKSAREFLRGRYARIHRHFDSLDQSKMLSLYIDSLAKSFDPHAAYLDKDCLTMWRIGLIPNYTLGLPLVYRRGDLWIRPTAHDWGCGGKSLAGYRIVAVRLAGQEPVHLSGLTDGVAIRTIVSPIGELGDARTVILELDDPKRARRMSIVADRWPPRR